MRVARFTRAWIETLHRAPKQGPSRVARFTRAWIETTVGNYCDLRGKVARFTRAWIETTRHALLCRASLSPASRGRGLKHSRASMLFSTVVARFTRAWIETARPSVAVESQPCRPLHAGVD